VYVRGLLSGGGCSVLAKYLRVTDIVESSGVKASFNSLRVYGLSARSLSSSEKSSRGGKSRSSIEGMSSNCEGGMLCSIPMTPGADSCNKDAELCANMNLVKRCFT
jgi:hypothetical protein